MLLDLRLKIYQFFKRHKNKIVIFLIIIGIIYLINQYLKHYDFQAIPSTTYNPDTPIMVTEGEEVPSNLKEPIYALIEEYFDACNEKDYEKAYSLLTEDCKKDLFPELDDFEVYVDQMFNDKKVYTVQNYYNEADKYVYRLRIFEDILATGLTGEEELGYRTEVITMHNTEDGMKLSVNGYIERKEMEFAVYEDDNVRITVESLKKEYEKETYTVKVYNKTEYQLVLLDHNMDKDQITLQLNAEVRILKNNTNNDIIISPGETEEFELEFTKYYHETDISRGIHFNALRFIKSFPMTYDEEGNPQNTIENYAITLNMQE